MWNITTFCIGWCIDIALNNIIKIKENFTDEATWWKNQEDEVSCNKNVHSEKFSFKVKDEGDFASEEKSKFVNGRWGLNNWTDLQIDR